MFVTNMFQIFIISYFARRSVILYSGLTCTGKSYEKSESYQIKLNHSLLPMLGSRSSKSKLFSSRGPEESLGGG